MSGYQASPGPWPTLQQQRLLDAALAPADRALAAFADWRSRVNWDDEFDWPSLRLFPLVHDHLAAFGCDDPAMGRLKGLHRRSWYLQQQLTRHVAPVVAALTDTCTPVMLLRGAAVAQGYYRSAALRPMNDVDLCVHASHAARAAAVVRDLGWRPAADLDRDLFRFRHAVRFVRPEGGELLLHWHVLPESAASRDDDRLWTDTEPVTFEGTPVLRARPTLLLMQQIVHGLHWRGNAPMRWVADAVLIARARSDEVDWDAQWQTARTLGVTTRLGRGLSYLADTFDITLPGNLRRAVRAVRPSWRERLEDRVPPVPVARSGAAMRLPLRTSVAEFARLAPARHPLAMLTEFPHYLRYTWGLKGRRELLAAFGSHANG